MVINRTSLNDADFLAALMMCYAREKARGAHPLVVDHWWSIVEEFTEQLRGEKC